MIKTVKPARKINRLIQDNLPKCILTMNFSTMTLSTMTHWV